MRTVIIEDELLAAKDLQKLIQQLDSTIEVVAILPGLAAARDWFSKQPEPDLLFMDIQLSDGVSFELFTHVKLECPVIFTTAYNEYAIQAFKVNSIDYLLKPIDRTELKVALEKFKKIKQINQPFDLQSHIQSLLQDLTSAQPAKKYKERFMAHYKNTLVPVPAERIAYFIKDELIYLVTYDNQKMIADFHTMDEVEQQLNPAQFFRANRQYIIHLNSVDHIRHGFNGKIIVKLRSPLFNELDISREKAAAFKDWIN
ncbi:LytTR family DNA-binding domain-containing protein [Rhodocytophaga aerolata]|uniref:LytTR family DNA-binding domain-containing protein n=1 Tax=Rhodocytophaga aerolata TaxID=455078 RepID=A0ABT8R480_9BACT|nr:LytTR family DNA-binding domain-containing protein [Rhodocytophaga aerolata]MDO1446093.1 LytTR family DNA-binding domain-containing protein [Rhodocytophaga aerolata]